MRPQPYRPKGKSGVEFEQPYATRLIIQMAPPELPRGTLPEPVRITTVDAHLGDALFRLNCALHFHINKTTGWIASRPTPAETAIATWEGAGSPSSDGRRYQTRIRRDDGEWWAFAPSTPDGVNQFLELYVGRINAAGWHPSVRFPCELDLSGIDLKGTELRVLAFSETTFNYARLEDAEFLGSFFGNCSFQNVLGRNSDFDFSSITRDRYDQRRVDRHGFFRLRDQRSSECSSGASRVYARSTYFDERRTGPLEFRSIIGLANSQTMTRQSAIGRFSLA